MAEPAVIDDAALPPLVAEIRDVIGLAATMALVDAYGGTVLQVPVAFDPTHPLVALIGHEAGAAFMHHFAREELYIGRCAASIRARRNREIAARHGAGTPVATLAREHALSVRQIWNILATAEAPDDGQTDLFAPPAAPPD